MIGYPDTSFLCALYRQQDHSPEAAAYFQTLPEPLHVSSLLLYEFRQSLRFQVWLYSQDRNKGFPQADCDKALAKLQANMDSGAIVIVAADWPEVYQIAERLSARHTSRVGNRALDTLHVATALHLGAKDFLSFDARQRLLARAEGLRPKP